MYIIGISCFYHDSSVCLIKNGEIIAAAQEERFSRLKHDWRFPIEAFKYCLKEANISINDISIVAFYEKPILKFERVIETFLQTSPKSLSAFIDIMPSWLGQKLWFSSVLQKKTNYRGKIIYSEHHLSHAASSFFLSPFEESAILTIDGVGEWATASYGFGIDNKIVLSHEMQFPNSLGLLYSAFTAFLGFDVNDGEYKVMGMAPYGSPVYYDIIKNKLIKIHPDGSITLNLEYFSFQYGRRMFNKKFEMLFGVKNRKPNEPIEKKHFDLASSIQKITEDIILKMSMHVYERTKMKKLCLAGGVSLNCVSNGLLLRNGPFEDIFIQPAAGDAGGAIGAAYIAYHHYLGNKDRHPLKNLYLGSHYSNEEIKTLLDKKNMRYKFLDREQLLNETASLLAEGNVIGWFQGKMEFGPRALGNRSIIADPRRPEMKDIINKKIKYREEFRPFAPSVILESVSDYFDFNRESPHMLFTVKVKNSSIPAVTHVDGSARIQTVKRESNPLFYDLIKRFSNLTGIPVVLNTSFNLKGEPIVMSPEDAINCFLKSGLDYLIIGNFLLKK